MAKEGGGLNRAFTVNHLVCLMNLTLHFSAICLLSRYKHNFKVVLLRVKCGGGGRFLPGDA